MFNQLKSISTSLFLMVMLVLLLSFNQQAKKTTVYLIGDSTMCDYPLRQFPVTGWGMPFANYFDNSVRIDNRAKGGRSTRTFIAENRWAAVADSLKAGDYVLIQFGHNDEAREPQYAARYTSAADYKKNLTRFILETRDKNAIPLLITPVSRRSFDKDGNAKEAHTEYTAAVFAVGEEYKVPVIDLDSKSRILYQQLGPERSKMLFMELDSGVHPNYPQGRHDNTHFNEYGARKIAEIVLNDLKEKQLELALKIVKGQNKTVVNLQEK